MRFENLSKDAREYIKAVIECIDDGIFILDDKSTIMEITAKCHGPAPLGVGTTTANVPAANMTNAAITPKCPVNPKQ